MLKESSVVNGFVPFIEKAVQRYFLISPGQRSGCFALASVVHVKTSLGVSFVFTPPDPSSQYAATLWDKELFMLPLVVSYLVK